MNIIFYNKISHLSDPGEYLPRWLTGFIDFNWLEVDIYEEKILYRG